jgi:hypothetical protein
MEAGHAMASAEVAILQVARNNRIDKLRELLEGERILIDYARHLFTCYSKAMDWMSVFRV